MVHDVQKDGESDDDEDDLQHVIATFDGQVDDNVEVRDGAILRAFSKV